jgi:hypothetical protein
MISEVMQINANRCDEKIRTERSATPQARVTKQPLRKTGFQTQVMVRC